MLRRRKDEDEAETRPEAKPDGNNSASAKPVQERPRICLIDVAEEVTARLRDAGFNCYNGTLGALVEVNNSSLHTARQCLPNCDFPPNLHEYDIVIVDLQQPKTVPYDEKEHMRAQSKGHRLLTLVSSFPEAIFDPRALSASILQSRLQPFLEKESILLIFAASHETTEYHPIAITPRGTERLGSETHSLYDFYPDLPYCENITGKDMRVVLKPGSELAHLLEVHNKGAIYDITFRHPTHWENHERVKDQNFIPLIEAKREAIVSFLCNREKNWTFLFPRIQRKQEFLAALLETALPGIVPGLFPFSTQFSWLANPDYHLPQESDLLDRKQNLKVEYETKLRRVEDLIDANRQEYGFLHELLKQSGPELVKTVERYLGWIGFDNVVNVDETNPDLQEEDLRVEDDRGLLVIEVKGIGGTSTDSECAQISKIKYRRSKERGAFDVFALYIVNHQRYLPPEARTNPPFNATQITDAKNDDRGLVTTYDLFKLFFNVIEGHVTKTDARNALYGTGLVRFPPSRATALPGPPYEIRQRGTVVILKVEDIEIKVGDSVVLDCASRYTSAKVLEIQVDGTPVESASAGEIGIKLSARLRKNMTLWLVSDDRE